MQFSNTFKIPVFYEWMFNKVCLKAILKRVEGILKGCMHIEAWFAELSQELDLNHLNHLNPTGSLLQKQEKKELAFLLGLLALLELTA